MRGFGPGNAQRDVVDFLLYQVTGAAQPPGFGAIVDLPQSPQHIGHQNHPQHAHGIGHRVAHSWIGDGGAGSCGRHRCAGGLDHRGQRRRVGQRSRIETGSDGRFQPQNGMGAGGDGGGDGQHSHSGQIVAQPFTRHRCHKARPTGQADRVDKEHQAQLEDHVGQLEGGIQRAHGQTHKQHRGHTQAGSLDLDTADGIANGGYSKEQQD